MYELRIIDRILSYSLFRYRTCEVKKLVIYFFLQIFTNLKVYKIDFSKYYFRLIFEGDGASSGFSEYDNLNE